MQSEFTFCRTTSNSYFEAMDIESESKIAPKRCLENCQCLKNSEVVSFGANDRNNKKMICQESRYYDTTGCTSNASGACNVNDLSLRKSDQNRAPCGCLFSNPSLARVDYSDDRRHGSIRGYKLPANTCETKCRCCDVRPRSSTISGSNNVSYGNSYRSLNTAVSNSTSRIDDFSKMYQQNRGYVQKGKSCNCRSNRPLYSNVKELTYAQISSPGRSDCRCATCCKAKGAGGIRIEDFKEPSNRKVCLDGRGRRCRCSDGTLQTIKRSESQSSKASTVYGNLCSNVDCVACKPFQKQSKNKFNHLDDDVDECDGPSSALRSAAIAENILEYEISALEYGISVVEGSAELFEYGRGLYVKEAEPKYQNVRHFAVEEKPHYKNLEEITRKYGNRLGPEGQNLEDEVYYENLTSVRHSIRGFRDQQAASSRILSASANNLLNVPPGDFYSGTFPQYVQKEMKAGVGRGQESTVLPRSQSDRGVVYTGDQNADTFVEVAKMEMCEVKQQRLLIAQNEYKHLSSALTALATSRTSLCSSGSGGSSRYDPELLRSDVALARGRVTRLRRELRQVHAELSCTQQGVNTLHSVEQKISTQQGCYNITEAQAIMTELRNIQKSLTSGEKEKAELMQSLAKLKDDLTRLQLGEVSPDTSTLSLPQEKLSTASQTDLCADLVPIGTRLAEMAQKRLQYDECRKRIQSIQQQLADLEDKVQPGQAESDQDRLLLFQEKEQLLRELRSITPRMKSQQQMTDIQLKCKRLERDLNNALEMSNRCIADRLKLHEEKQLLLQQLRDALRSMTTLESQLKSLSASTLSVSSSSSLGSLSTTSSKGSLSSGLSFTDIYGGPQGVNASMPPDKPIDMVDLHLRVEKLLRGSPSNSGLATGLSSGSQPSLSPRSSLSSVSPPISPPAAPPPAYDLLASRPHRPPDRQLEDRLAELRLMQQDASCDSQAAMMARGQEPPLSPIEETPAVTVAIGSRMEVVMQQAALIMSATPSSSGTNSRSVSAAVSDESVAGDSGVFEASCRSRDIQPSIPADSTAQVQIKLHYSQEEQTLYVGVQKIRNLHALAVKPEDTVYMRAMILPACREAGAPLPAPLRLPLPLPHSLLKSQTLRLQACRRQRCLGFAQVSLADFSNDVNVVRWYNILAVVEGIPCREESSDESTLIPSQTSTLTRNQGGGDEGMLAGPVDSPPSSDDEQVEGDDGEDDEEALLVFAPGSHYSSSIHQIMEEEPYLDPELDHQLAGEEYPQNIQPSPVLVEVATATEEKETNTECNFCPEGGARRRINGASAAQVANDDRLVIKRSQTFSPTPQLGKNQYICRLNRSESDSSMPLYRRGGTSHLQSPGAPFDRHAATRRSLRLGRTPLPGLVPVTRGPRAHAPRTSLDLELDLRAQHHRLDTLKQEIAGLRDLKQRLEVAKEEGDTTVANWVVEDDAFTLLCSQGAEVSGNSASGGIGSSCGSNAAANQQSGTGRRATRALQRALQRAFRDIYRLRRTRAPKGKPDLITFKEKMAFFTRHHSSVPIPPGDEDILALSSSRDDTLKREDAHSLSHLLENLTEWERAPRGEEHFHDGCRPDGRLSEDGTLERLDSGDDRRNSSDCGSVSGSERNFKAIERLDDMLGNGEEVDEADDGRETPDSCQGFQIGYRVRRSGRCSNVTEKSHKHSQNATSAPFDEKSSIRLSDAASLLTSSTDDCPRFIGDDSVDGIQTESVAVLPAGVKNELVTNDVVSTDKNGDLTIENGRFQYVVDRVLGVQV